MTQVLTGDPLGWILEKPTAITVGVFDGVHLGHQAVMARLREVAENGGLVTGALTFEPHPLELVNPAGAPKLLTSIEQRIEMLAECGMEVVGVLPFLQIRDLPPRMFALEVLAQRLQARHVAVGADFRFGQDRAGDIASLAAFGEEGGFEVEVVEMVGAVGGEVVSATRIRSLIAAGEVMAAARFLGRPFEVRGQVIRGDGRGRTIGFPTANLYVPERMAVPADGVYAAWAELAGETFPSLVNIGVRPTFGSDRRVVEAYLVDFEGDLYGRELALRFVDRLRPERRFESVEALVEQLHRDVETGRTRLTHQSG